jgi:cytochrome c
MRATFLALALMLPALPAVAGDADRGRTLFQRQCASCHQAAQPRNGVGPHLMGVVGRPAASVAGANYSPAMRNAGITWSAEELDSFLTNPAARVPGSRMPNRVAAPADREDIIEFLRGIAPPG